MSNYKQATVAGESWQRAHTVVVANPYDGTPVIDFREEEIVLLADGRSLKTDKDHLVRELPPEVMGTTFELRNPDTGELLNQTATFADVAVMLHSLYYHLANERDTPPVQVEEEPQV